MLLEFDVYTSSAWSHPSLIVATDASASSIVATAYNFEAKHAAPVLSWKLLRETGGGENVHDHPPWTIDVIRRSVRADDMRGPSAG